MELEEHILDIIEFMRSIGFQVDPLPEIEYDQTENDPSDMFIKTGYYTPEENKLTLCVSNRHLKDILRTFCHEMVHHNQNLTGKYKDYNTEGKIYENRQLYDVEKDAYDKGNLLFRYYTELKQSNQN